MHNEYPLIHDSKKIIEEDFVKNIGNELYEKNVVDLKSINLAVPYELLDIQNYPNSNPTSAPIATATDAATTNATTNATATVATATDAAPIATATVATATDAAAPPAATTNATTNATSRDRDRDRELASRAAVAPPPTEGEVRDLIRRRHLYAPDYNIGGQSIRGGKNNNMEKINNMGFLDLLRKKKDHDFINELDHYNLEIKGKNEIKITIFLIIYCAFIIHSEFINKIVNITNDSYIIALSEIFYKYNKVLLLQKKSKTDGDKSHEYKYTLLEFLIDMIKLIYNDFGALMINRITYATDDEKKEYEKIFIQESIKTDSFEKYRVESINNYKNKSIDYIKTELQAKKGFIFTQLNDIHIDKNYIKDHYNGFFKLTNITSSIDSALFLQNIFKIENLVIPKDICKKSLYVGNGQMSFTSHGLFPRYFNLDARFSTSGSTTTGVGVFLYGTMTDSIKSPDNRNILGIQMRNMDKKSYGGKGYIRESPKNSIDHTKGEVKDEHKARLHHHITHLEDPPLKCIDKYHTNYLNAYFNDFYEKFMIVGYSLKGDSTIYSIFKPYLDSIKGKYYDLSGILVDNNGNGDIKIMETNTNIIKTDLYLDRNVLQKATYTGERRVFSVVKRFIIKMTEEFKKGSSISFYVTPIKNLDSINGQFNMLTFGGDKSEESISTETTPTEQNSIPSHPTDVNYTSDIKKIKAYIETLYDIDGKLKDILLRILSKLEEDKFRNQITSTSTPPPPPPPTPPPSVGGKIISNKQKITKKKGGNKKNSLKKTKKK